MVNYPLFKQKRITIELWKYDLSNSNTIKLQVVTPLPTSIFWHIHHVLLFLFLFKCFVIVWAVFGCPANFQIFCLSFACFYYAHMSSRFPFLAKTGFWQMAMPIAAAMSKSLLRGTSRPIVSTDPKTLPGYNWSS